MRSYIDILHSAEARLGITIPTLEYEILASLFDVEVMTPKELFALSRASSTAFYATLANLESKGAIHASDNPADRRSRLYGLSDRTVETLARQWDRFQNGGYDDVYIARDPQETLHNYTRTIRSILSVTQFTCEFQILLYLQVCPGMANIRFSDLIDVSNSKFNHSLRHLTDSRLIYFEKDSADRRSKLYYLSEEASRHIAGMREETVEWLARQARFNIARPGAPQAPEARRSGSAGTQDNDESRGGR